MNSVYSLLCMRISSLDTLRRRFSGVFPLILGAIQITYLLTYLLTYFTSMSYRCVIYHPKSLAWHGAFLLQRLYRIWG